MGNMGYMGNMDGNNEPREGKFPTSLFLFNALGKRGTRYHRFEMAVSGALVSKPKMQYSWQKGWPFPFCSILQNHTPYLKAKLIMKALHTGLKIFPVFLHSLYSLRI